MKISYLLILFFIYVKIVSQDFSTENIRGCYWVVGFQTYVVIDSATITKITYCNRDIHPVCESSISIVSTDYVFRNDTLSFNFGKWENDINFYNEKWVYNKSTGNFISIDLGVFERARPESINKILQEFNLQLIE